jgi:hypothetical protein
MTPSKNFSDRLAALQAFEAEHRDTFAHVAARCKAELREAEDARDAALSAARTEQAAVADELEADIAADVRAVIWPLLQGFGDQPRTVAARIALEWRALDARCREELGAELSWTHLAVAVAHVHDLAPHVGNPEYLKFSGDHAAPSAVQRAVRAILAKAAPVVVEHEIRTAEVAIAQRGHHTFAPNAARLEVLTSRATENAICKALAKHDAEAAEAARVAYENSPEQAEWRERHGAEQTRLASKDARNIPSYQDAMHDEGLRHFRNLAGVE